MPKPERRTRADLIAAASIVVLVVVLATLVWWRSPERHTSDEVASGPVVPAPAALQVPTAFTEAWSAPSPATALPTVESGAVVTADSGSVVGRDARTGRQIWKYQRDIALCGVVGAWDRAVSVYRDRRGCSEVTALDAATGVRQPQRSSLADHTVQLSTNGTYVVSRGDTRLEVWRSDLVRTLEYGRVDAPVNPDAQPRTGCTLRSDGIGNSRLAVVETCPGEQGDRLTVMSPAPKDPGKPEPYGSTILIGNGQAVRGARILAVSGQLTAVFLPGTTAQIGIFDGDANLISAYPVATPPDGGADVTAAVDDSSMFTFWTGDSTVALNAIDLTPRWTVPGTLGPGTMMAGSLLVPTPGAVAVVDVVTGRENARIPVPRPENVRGPIGLAATGDMLLERRGPELVALKGS
ncbi:PQQ-binding-like beta-propeller repeat protein [Rhodococcus sp. D2-41]|uniref:PQQ-binding-like beta-propeller repeat protein n=1 Tax=Speluncibacter jeojiensis TaxID=2710754 RepID=A0A9X4RBZ6_9ACTN|nr:hypothetical protein [Rhodococcus sp. D2-41]MDG3008763.1 PQQ-binding-like beta-propeller repeat protein [Rhodococcus sp. D2-41]MDG3013028.1 hypothetical protein [Corynebacteriales bacterium D3-21]